MVALDEGIAEVDSLWEVGSVSEADMGGGRVIPGAGGRVCGTGGASIAVCEVISGFDAECDRL